VLRTAITLRTGVKIFESTECRCGKFVDRLELHGLSCVVNASLLYSQKVIDPHWSPLFLEPVGLMEDRSNSDCMTLNQGRRQDVAAGGAKNYKGGPCLNTMLDVCRNRHEKVVCGM